MGADSDREEQVSEVSAAAGGVKVRVPGSVPGRLGSLGRRLLPLLPAIPIIGLAVVVAWLVGAAPNDRPFLAAAIIVAAAAGLSATTVGVFGGLLVPGLLLLGIGPVVVVPLSLILQILVVPIGVTTHVALGNVRRSITFPLIVGGIVGSVAGALAASFVAPALVSRSISLVIIVIGLILLANIALRPMTVREGRRTPTRRIGGIGVAAGFASGISGAGWGPIGVKLLLLAGVEPAEAIGSSLVGRFFMAVAAIAAYAVVAWQTPGKHLDTGLVIPLGAAALAAMVGGAALISRFDRTRASIVIACLSIGLAVPTLLFGAR
jgi:uncharacterized protein